MKRFADAPMDWMSCPKCGEGRGWAVMYRAAFEPNAAPFKNVPEHLEWSCRFCGYAERTLCADASPVKEAIPA